MTPQMRILKAKVARAMAAKKKSDGAALDNDDLRAQGRREADAAIRAEESARADLRERGRGR